MINKTEAKARIAKLRELINNYRYHYHVLDESIMSEAAADSLKHELTLLETAYPDLITPDSPTQRVAGQPLDKFTKVAHQERMVSLVDVFSADEVKDWLLRIEKLVPGQRITEFFTDIKMDGLACALHYQDGLFTQAVTRGDGLVGEDVTMNVRTIANLPLRIDQPGHTEVRGEIIIYKADFEKLQATQRAKGEKEFANPRNLAAGSIRQLDPKIAASRALRFIAYDLVTPDLPTHQAAYTKLRALKFQTSGVEQTFSSLNDVLKRITEMETQRQALPFDTDGLVVKVNSRKIYRELGIIGKTPRAAVAFKFPAEEATTQVRDIVISIGRTGAATPVAILDPVKVDGSTVQHASLHNADEIARLDLRIGDTVIIYKAGDIIPQIKTVLTELRPANTQKFDFLSALRDQYPELQFERQDGEVAYRVKGENSKFILKRAIEYYASKSALDIEGLGEKNVAALIDAGLVKSIADLYRLTVSDVAKLEGFAELSAQNLITAIQNSKRPPLHKFITALGIRHVGVQTANTLATEFGSMANLMAADEERLLEIPDVGLVVARSILAYFVDPDNQAVLEELKSLGVQPITTNSSHAPLKDQSYIITGTLTSMDRETAEDKLRTLGANVTSSVTKHTTAVIIGANPGQTKITKAKQLNIPQITEADFLKLIAG